MHEFHLAAEIIKPRRTRQVMFFDMFSRLTQVPTSDRRIQSALLHTLGPSGRMGNSLAHIAVFQG
jgi:hypothetical protein